MPDKELVIFDIDGTIALSKCAIDDEMASLLSQLLSEKKVAIVSGGAFPQFHNNIILPLEKIGNVNFKNLFLQPTTGARLFVYKNGEWKEEYADLLTEQEKHKILPAVEKVLESRNWEKPQSEWGEQIEDRGTQITLSTLGQKAPIDVKQAWDPDFSKRKALQADISKLLPEFDVKIGGTTSIDITHKGINKAYAVRKLHSYLKLGYAEMMFVGDALYEDGNDYVVKETGIVCVSVKDPEDTKRMIEKWLS